MAATVAHGQAREIGRWFHASVRTSRQTVVDSLALAERELVRAGVATARRDAELLLAEAAGRSQAELVAHPGRELAGPAARRFDAMIERRVAREPVAYILGRRGFRRIELEVDRRVLIPRPESELLVELALELEPCTVLDVGTGCGAIALAVADELSDVEVTATDTSADALELGRRNAERLGLVERVRFELGSAPAGGAWDLVLANLPYVAEADRPRLAPEIVRHEPGSALFAGADGLDAIRGLLAQPPACEVIALEVGAGQAGEVGRLVAGAGFGSVAVRIDLAGIERVVVGSR